MRQRAQRESCRSGALVERAATPRFQRESRSHTDRPRTARKRTHPAVSVLRGWRDSNRRPVCLSDCGIRRQNGLARIALARRVGDRRRADPLCRDRTTDLLHEWPRLHLFRDSRGTFAQRIAPSRDWHESYTAAPRQSGHGSANTRPSDPCIHPEPAVRIEAGTSAARVPACRWSCPYSTRSTPSPPPLRVSAW